MKQFLFLITFSLFSSLYAQNGYWQQHVDYYMNIDFDAVNGKFTGTQRLIYTNNSPDTLYNVYYHLYYNAFQPGSQMDIRNYTIKDSDGRIGNRIQLLYNEDRGYQKIISLKQDDKKLKYTTEGTVLEVTLNNPVLPGEKTIFNMEFESQVPLLIRRSGKINAEGIEYSMAQWYPKMAEYDKDGWHANEYIAREFYGVWGNFDVDITIDSSYTVAATGYLQNADEIGHGYSPKHTSANTEKLTWKFHAPMVHDFVWAADPDYKHEIISLRDGLDVHLFYQIDTANNNWDSLKYYIKDVFEILDTTFGKYPYKQFSFIQGGDGGMEYPMATLIVSKKSFDKFISTAVHELIHNWYYGVLANNESANPWMDEGFTSFAEDYVMDVIMPKSTGPRLGSSDDYLKMVDCDHQESLNTPGDFYGRNQTYYKTVYQKGELFLSQLNYIVGDETFYKGMIKYFNTWKYKHPQPLDFLRIMEKQADMELDWFYHYWIETTFTIDYGIKYFIDTDKGSSLVIERLGRIPIPVELNITYKDGREELFYIPLRMMRGKKEFNKDIQVISLPDWPWTYPEYEIILPVKTSDIAKIEIDKHHLTTDTNRKNNSIDAYTIDKSFSVKIKK